MLHRAAGHGGERCSVGFFLEPDFETAAVAPAGGPPVSYARHDEEEIERVRAGGDAPGWSRDESALMNPHLDARCA